MQRRLERYAAMGPNCPNGHPWSANAKFDYRGSRFCDACAREKAERRLNDPTTFIGTCPHGQMKSSAGRSRHARETGFADQHCFVVDNFLFGVGSSEMA
jgi:hypothetical protein